MVRSWKKWLTAVLSAALMLGVAGVMAAEAPGELADAQPGYVAEHPNQIPLTGYYRADVPGQEGREVLWYLPETANIRPFFFFIAVDDGVDPDQFLVDSGWKQISEETGEGLYILLPNQETKTWGTPEEELAYLKAARDLHGSSATYFTTLGEFYLVGYGAGAAPLMQWAAEFPNLVIAQTYVGGASAPVANLEFQGNRSFGFQQMTDGDINGRSGLYYNDRRDVDNNQKILKQMTARLKDILNPDAGYFAGLLKKQDMAVPTWFINPQDTDALAYWQKVNKAEGEGVDITELEGLAVEGKCFPQTEDTWTTQYAGQISKVVCVTTEASEDYAFTRAIRDALADYMRYDVTISYGNALVYRLDYSAAVVESKKNDYAKTSVTVEGLTLDNEPFTAEISYQRIETSEGALTDLLMFVPDTAPAEKIPVAVVMHGASQTATLFFDTTMWWQTAAKEGFALAYSTRTSHSGFRFPGNLNTDVFAATYDILEADGRFDLGRIYVTGQSAGAGATCQVAEAYPEKVAAVMPTNSGGFRENQVPMPWVQFVGEGNYANRGIPGFVTDTTYPEDETPFLTRSAAAAEAGADIYWDPHRGEGSTNGMTLFASIETVNKGILRDEIVYHLGDSLNGGTDTVGTIADFDTNNARVRTFIWEDENGTPVAAYNLSLFQAHNCQPFYRPIGWDLLKHYSIDADGNRWYSESAYAEDDAVQIFAE